MKRKNIIVMVLLSCATLSAHAQEKSAHEYSNISGYVVDKWGNPVAGAKVTTLDKTGTAAYTARDGKFSIVGYDSPRLQIETSDKSRTTVDTKDAKGPLKIVIGYDAQAIDIGYGVIQNIGESTVSASVVKNEEFDKRSAKNIGNSLFGYGLGLTTLQGTGEFTAVEPTLYVRGLQTISGNSPLILVDGVERSISFITPEEVENVTILKDAPAVALYGYRGINGAINITTKRGKYKTREIKFSYDHAINWEARRPKLADAYTYASAMNEALSNDGKALRYSQNELDAFKSGKYPQLYPNVNWIEEAFKNTGSTNLFNLSFRGGGQKVRYYSQLNLQMNDGFVKNANLNDGYSTQNKYSKANFRTNLDIDLTSTTKLAANLDGVLLEASRAGMSSDNIWWRIYSVPSAAFPIKLDNGIWGGNSTYGASNPVAIAQGGRAYSKGHTRALYADLQLSQDLSGLTPGLGATFKLAYDNVVAYWENHTRSFKFGNYTVTGWENGEPQYDASKPWTNGTDSGLASDSKMDWQNRIFLFAGGFNYNRTFGNHEVSSLLMWNYTFQNFGGQNNTYYRQNASLYGHYGYKGKYFADLTLTASASNKLAPGHKWALSPTLSVAWALSKENFMKNISFIDFMKLRASWGIINVDNYPAEGYWLQTFGGGGSYPFSDPGGNWSGGWSEGRLPSLNSSHEKGYKYNIGLDATVLGGLNLTIDGYYQRRSGIWVSNAGNTSSVLGGSASYVNGGIVDSWGVEVGADYIKRIGKDWLFNVGGNFTLAKNKVVEQLEAPQAYDYLRSTGKRIWQTWGYQAVGFFKDQADIDNSPAQQFSEVKPGDIKYKDQNNDGVINSEDAVAMGYNTYCPEIYYSFHVGGEWKGLGIDAQFQGVANYTAVLNTASLYWPLISNYTISNHYYNNRWTPETPNAKYPRLTSEGNPNNFQNNSVWLEDRSFLKLRHVELYYKLPSAFVRKSKFIDNAKLYVRGVDLLCFDHIKIADPEQYGATYPVQRSVVIGLNLGF